MVSLRCLLSQAVVPNDSAKHKSRCCCEGVLQEWSTSTIFKERLSLTVWVSRILSVEGLQRKAGVSLGKKTFHLWAQCQFLPDSFRPVSLAQPASNHMSHFLENLLILISFQFCFSGKTLTDTLSKWCPGWRRSRFCFILLLPFRVDTWTFKLLSFSNFFSSREVLTCFICFFLLVS